ncbi:MAG: hypothetical protein B7X04_00345 [Parcubacteria group bacterium 21-54-25]|nr:MAG: hypothetical protein B7X04_00345 [Parcubacteria group bacterium 21-54-25]
MHKLTQDEALMQQMIRCAMADRGTALLVVSIKDGRTPHEACLCPFCANGEGRAGMCPVPGSSVLGRCEHYVADRDAVIREFPTKRSLRVLEEILKKLKTSARKKPQAEEEKQPLPCV